MMKSKLWRVLSGAGVLALALAFVVGLSGCNSDKTPEPQPVKPAQPLPTHEKEKVELRPVESGEVIRRHIFDASGVETETRIEYANGDKGVIKLRADGTIERFTVTKSDGKLKVDKLVAADGETVIGGKQMRDDNTVILTWTQLPDGNVKLTAYWWDGKRVFAEQVVRKDGTVDTVYTRKNGKRWGHKVHNAKGEVLTSEEHDADGNLQSRRENTAGGGWETTHYRKDGTAAYKQVVKNLPNQYGSTSMSLAEVLEYKADGKTVQRQIIPDNMNYGQQLKETTTYNDDGTLTVRAIRSGYENIIDKETVKDKTGKVISEKEYKDEVVREEVERERLNLYNYKQEPTNVWQYAERYEQWRNETEQ